MSEQIPLDPKLDFAIERFIDAPVRLVWDAWTDPGQVAPPNSAGVARNNAHA